MNPRGWVGALLACALSLLFLVLGGCTCGGGSGSGGDAERSEAGAFARLETAVLQPTRAGEPVALLPALDLDGAGPPPGASGNGLQVLQVSPQGVGRHANQVAVVFDRPMVALTELDTMGASVPVRCEAGFELVGQWAGTSTAVLVPRTPDATIPLASEVRCIVPAGTTSLDGTSLDNDIRWTFETARPALSYSTPHDGAEGVELTGPIRLRFDQPVTPEALKQVLTLTDARGRPVAIESITVWEHDPHSLTIAHEALAPDTAYTLTLAAGLRGESGPLPTLEDRTIRFRTYPPFALLQSRPFGTVDPVAWFDLRFSTPVSQAEVSKHLSIEPAPVDDWSPPDATWSSRNYTYAVRLAPRTHYTVRLAEGLNDIHGQTLPPQQWSFTTGDHSPRIDVERGFRIYAANNPDVLPFHHLNARTIDVRLGAVPAARALEAILGKTSVADLLEGVPVHHLAPEAEVNRVGVGALALGEHLVEGRGLVGWSLSSPEIRDRRGLPVAHEGLALVTDLGATLKVSPGASDVWVTRLSDGRPVEGATIELYRGRVRVASGSTDPQGLAHLVGQPDPSWSRWSDGDALYAIARLGHDFTVVRQDWNDGIAPWHFGIWSDWDADARSGASHGFLDRGVYRPGDTVHARATFRIRSAAGLELPGADAGVRWIWSGPDGGELAEGKGSLDDRGGIDLKMDIPADGRLGDYTLRVTASGPGWQANEWLRAPVRAYRPPAFRVQVDAPGEAVLGEEIAAAADARYLFGTPLSEAEVQWRTWTEPTWFHPRGYEGFSFGPEWQWWAEEWYGGTEVLDSVAAALEEGRHLLRSSLDVGRYDRPVRWFLEAEVVDVDRQAIANRAEVLVHPARWYLGLRPEARLPGAGQPAGVEVVAVDPDGTPRAAEATLRVMRRSVTSVREEGLDGRWRWRHQTVEEPVFEQQVRLGARPTRLTFTPEKPGEHVIELTGADSAGNPIRAADVVYAIGPSAVSWELSDDQRLELVPEKARYAPGETARILVKAPKPGLSALVTAERETVLHRQVVTLDGTAAVVEVPITAEHRPNLFVSVVAVTGAGPQDAPDKGRPEVRVGMVELEVDSSSEHLTVRVDTDREVYRPRDRVEAVVRVEREGRPLAGAGVTLFAVDEAVLSLTAYDTPDAHSTFYAHRNLGTYTADTRLRVLDRAPWLTKGAPTGGGGGIEDADDQDVRSRFLTTIAWEPDLRTRPDGTVRASFELPDNLTTFRIMAVVDEGATAFGSADREIRVTRPLIVRPALPRFLRTGDTSAAGVVLHNNSGSAMRVEVEASVTGPVQLEGQPATVTVPAHGAVEVPFALHANGEGEVVFEFVARAGNERDAVRHRLPVRRDLVLETVATTGMTSDAARERIARPDGVLDGVGSLQVDVASTVLVGAGSGLEYLQSYPHRCVEQITSRALASLEAVELVRAGVLDLDAGVLSTQVEHVLRDLPDYDHHTGGITYWPGSATPSVMGTAYVVELLARAEERGMAVDRSRLARHVRFLREVLSGRHPEQYLLDAEVSTRSDLGLAIRAHASLALARAGEGDAGHANLLFAQRHRLSAAGQAALLETILRTTGPDARTAELEQALLARLTVDAAGASIREDAPWYRHLVWGSDDFTTAATLEALLLARADHPMANRLARHLVSSRKHGRWANTRATAGVLSALTRYALLHETGSEVLQARVALAGRELVRSELPRPGSMGVDLPLSDVANGELVFEALQGGPLYYDARLSYVPMDPPPRDHGFTLRRSYEVLEGGGSGGEILSGALVRVTLQVVTPGRRYGVALVDPLPAGFEPVEQSFATTSRAPLEEADDPSLPPYGGSWAFDHQELLDHEVRLYASDMRPGVHVWRYLVRATTPGDFEHPPATVSEMYEPEVFGRTPSGRLIVGRDAP